MSPALTITSFGFQPSFAASRLAANFPNAKMRYAFAFET